MKTSKFVSKSPPEIDTFAHKIKKIALHTRVLVFIYIYAYISEVYRYNINNTRKFKERKVQIILLHTKLRKSSYILGF